MKHIILLILVLVVALAAQTGNTGQIDIKPLGTSGSCVADPTGDVLCAGSDGFYVSIAGGPFQKIVAGAIPPPPSPTKISCTTAALSTGSSGTLTASGCTFQ
jgi:hypothetical protein